MMKKHMWIDTHQSDIDADLLLAWQTFWDNPEQETFNDLLAFFSKQGEWCWPAIASMPLLLDASPRVEDEKMLAHLLRIIEELIQEMVHVYYYYEDLEEGQIGDEQERWRLFRGKETVRHWIPMSLAYISQHLSPVADLIDESKPAIELPAINIYYQMMRHCKGDPEIRQLVMDRKLQQEKLANHDKPNVQQLVLFG